MSRQDGTFPSKKDLVLSVNDPPDYSTSKRCPVCDFHWPNHEAIKESPCHGSANLQIDGNPPDIDWDAAVSRILHYLFGKWYDKYDGDTNDDVFPWVSEPLEIDPKELELGLADIKRTLEDIENISE